MAQIKPTLQQTPLKPTFRESAAPLQSNAMPVKPGRPNKGGNDIAQPFRPVCRPPIAILDICDDGVDDGESIRIRSDSITIGRSDADVIIPHDSQISSTHARLSRRFIEGAFQWFITDLDSTNGTFLRVTKAILAEGRMVLLGSHRYVFRAAQAAAATSGTGAATPKGTQGWQSVSKADLGQFTPSLVRLNPDGSTRAISISGLDLRIGQSADCQIVVTDDPAVSGVHATLRRGKDGRFVLEDVNSTNGVWLAIRERRAQDMLQFQLGEQRFRLRIPVCT